VSKNILQDISQLDGINITEMELNVCINNKLGEMEDFIAQMESISEMQLLLFGCQCLKSEQSDIVNNQNTFSVMHLVMDQEVQHIIALPADLQFCLHPIQLHHLEELSCLQLSEEDLLSHSLFRPQPQLI